MMHMNYLAAANHLYNELRAFRETRQHWPAHSAVLQMAQQRLQTVIAQLEPLGEDPGDAWKRLEVAQRWGYIRLVSFLGTATYELHPRNGNSSSTRYEAKGETAHGMFTRGARSERDTRSDW